MLDLKQKARITSSGGGSCYYGGMMSHATTQSVCMPATYPRAFSFTGGMVGSGVKLPRHNASLRAHSSLCVYTPSTTEASGSQQGLAVWKPAGSESRVFTRNTRATKENDDCDSQGAEEPDSLLSVKELETIL